MGISAAVAFQPDVSGEENEANMREAAEMVHTASITYAVRDTLFDGHEIHEGDIMGLVDNKISRLGHDVAEVAKEAVEEMVTDDSELITIFYGQDVDAAAAEALHAEMEEKYNMCDVSLHPGGQPLYYYIISVE